MKTRKNATYNNFRGVDLSSSPLEVKPYHSVDMSNLLLKNGILRKRKGTLQVDKFADKINGVWTIEIDSEEYIIVQVGKLFYRSELNIATQRYDHTALDITNGDETTDAYVKDERAFGVVKNNKLYIACGDYLVFGKWSDDSVELRRVYKNEDTYIPTTTISIDADGVSDLNRYFLDDINLLTPLRKNTLVGTTEMATYTVDSGAIKADTEVTIVGTILGGYEISYVNSDDGLTFGTSLYDEALNVVGTVVFATGKVTFNNDLSPIVANDSNLTITFEADYEDFSVNSSKITKCNMGILFGNSSDRVFLTGNEDYPNIDYYSESDDFTYFSDLNYTVFGSSDTSIGSYARMNDGTMAVIKYQAPNEPSIYFRTIDSQPIYFDIYDGTTYVGQKVIGYKDIFPIKAGTSGISVMSKYATNSLNSDNLLLLKNGVHSIQLLQNVATDERIVVHRGKPIQQAILDSTSLSDAISIVYDNKYILNIGSKCYVADANYGYDDKNYEWFVLDNISARVFFIYQDKLFYGDSEGKIVEVFVDNFVDSTYLYGGVTAQVSGVWYVASSYDVEDDDFAYISSDSIYYELIAEDLTLTESGLSYGSQYLLDSVVYVDGVEDTGLLIDTEYDLVFDLETLSFKLYLDDVEQVITSGMTLTNLKILKVINNRKLQVKDVEIGEVSGTAVIEFNLYDNSDLIELYISTNYPLPSGAKEVYFYREIPVGAYWYSGVTDLGDSYIAKTFTDLYCTPEQLPFGTMEIGYKTYTSNQAHSIINSGGFKFTEIAFSNFKFSSIDFPSGFRINIMERDKNFIQFRFSSSNNKDCGMNNFGVKYILNREIKGVE